MEPKTSKKTGRAFYVRDSKDPLNGLPSFTPDEVKRIAELDPTIPELNYLFDQRLKGTDAIEDCLTRFFQEQDATTATPREELGYGKPKKPVSPTLETIRQIIQTTKIKGARD